MSSVLVHCYFCPAARHRPGGVQQIVGPLLEALNESFGSSLEVVHPGPCAAPQHHQRIPDPVSPSQPDAIDPVRLTEAARCFQELEAGFEVVLSVDRCLPSPPSRPAVLMSNTLCYQTEFSAVIAGQWSHILAPTHRYAARLRSIVPAAHISVIPYGLHPSILSTARSLTPLNPSHLPSIVRLPNRPDPRKGHTAAIEGLARSLPASRDTCLEIAWLYEERYENLRSELVTLATKRRVIDQVSFVPWLDGSSRWEATARSRAALQLGAFEESFGLSMIESVLSGRPVVTLSQPAIREVVGTNPLYIEATNALGWFWRLERFWDRGDRPQKDGSQLALLRSLSLDRMAASYDQVLRQAGAGG